MLLKKVNAAVSACKSAWSPSAGYSQQPHSELAPCCNTCDCSPLESAGMLHAITCCSGVVKADTASWQNAFAEAASQHVADGSGSTKRFVRHPSKSSPCVPLPGASVQAAVQWRPWRRHVPRAACAMDRRGCQQVRRQAWRV